MLDVHDGGKALPNRNIVATRRGGPGVLEFQTTKMPVPDTGEVVVRVEAAGVLLGDVFWQKGLIPGAPKPPFVPGYDVVGVIERVGSDVRGWSVGNRVAAIIQFGGYAEHVCVPATKLARVPETIGADTLSAITMGYVTAHQIMTRHAKLEPGAKVLVHGGAGATGSAFLDLGRTLGIEIWGTASKAKHDIIKSYGARAIDYRNEDFVTLSNQHVPGGFDLVVDPIGGKHLDRSWACVGRGGHLVCTAAMSALAGASTLSTILGFAKLPLRNALPNGKSAAMFDVVAYNKKHPDAFGQSMSYLIALLEAGKLQPLIHGVFPLDDAAEVQRALIEGKTRGRVFLTP